MSTENNQQIDPYAYIKSLPPIRNCVFCGCRANAMNKEHVIPQWLMEFTGGKCREVYLGRRYESDISNKEGKLLYLPFVSLVVPSCVSCNTQYSILETAAGEIMRQICNGEKISTANFSIFLDWLDKIRLGSWIAGLHLSGNPLGTIPKFRINNRIAKYDQIVWIARTNSSKKMMQFSTIDNPVFSVLPTFFSIVVNGVSIITHSTLGCFQPLVDNSVEHLIGSNIIGTGHIEIRPNRPARKRQSWNLFSSDFKIFGRPRKYSDLCSSHIESNGHQTDRMALDKLGYSKPLKERIYQNDDKRFILVPHDINMSSIPVHEPDDLLMKSLVQSAKLELEVARQSRRSKLSSSRRFNTNLVSYARYKYNLLRPMGISEYLKMQEETRFKANNI